jgi:hypothetical protein
MSRIYVPGAKSKGDGENVTGNFNELYVPEAKDIRSKRIAELEMKVAGRIGAKLVRTYNNRQWKVNIDLTGGMLVISCDSVSNHMGYHIHTRGRTVHELEQRSIMAAGEILERHAMARSKHFNPDKFEGLIRDVYDNVITSDSVPEPI